MIRPSTRAKSWRLVIRLRRPERATHVTPTRDVAPKFAGCLVLMAIGLCVGAVSAQTPALRRGEELRRAWEEESFAASWQGVATRDALTRLTRERRVAAWLDRRLDPDRLLDIVIPDDTLEVGCRRIAGRLDAAVCRLDGVVYFGPQDCVRRLPTIAALRRAEVEERFPDRRPTFVAPKAMEWPELTEPRQLVARLASEAGLSVPELDKRVPHDLWAARQLPPLAWADRLTLVLAGFDLTFSIAGSQLAIEPFPESPVIERTVAPKGTAARVAAELSQKYPEVEVKTSGAKIIVRGRWEDVELAERLARGQKVTRPQVREGVKTFTMKVDQQTSSRVLQYIAEQQRLTLEIPDALRDALEVRVSFAVENASLADLLAAALRGTGCEAEIRESRVILKRSPP
ncbi:MAG: hypothetical protein U0939_12375 [Pirellulales bacterium]